ncbi:uncharacterized protein LOC117824306 [Notolabrus celidotus]|uniref:uncharacterized protein LOC117824306 n=1 Tax=Notolabrus celidotus TaxID=1203425 RepID=UPI0014904816|nr:uncharacterized protein LOC117824306 [Notolabrus celidotus]
MEFKWIQISLFLTALLQFTAAAEEVKTVRVGEDVTLSCENLIKNQPECSYTIWNFVGVGNSFVELIRFGQISENIGAKSVRLSVTEDCSLVIKKVTEEDVGLYNCRQHPPLGEPLVFALVYLSLLNMTETKDGDQVTLCCSVRTYEQCTLGVKWLFEGRDVDVRHQSVVTSKRVCSTDVTIKTYHHMYKSKPDSLQCEVTAGNKVRLFPFRLQPSGEKPGDGLTAETTPGVRGCSGLDFIMLSLRVVELVLITLLTVLLFRARGNQRPPDDITVRYDGDDDTVNCENAGEPSASVRLH